MDTTYIHNNNESEEEESGEIAIEINLTPSLNTNTQDSSQVVYSFLAVDIIPLPTSFHF